MSNWLKHLSFLCGCLLAAAIVAFLALSCAVTRGAEPQAPIPNGQSPVLLDFYADWCGPCQTMGPTVNGLAQAGYCVERINIDQNQTLAARYGVERIPCFIMVHDGRETDRVVGPTDYRRLEAMFQNAGRLTPAWRYERPAGCRSAIVRIFCQDGARMRSIGSGTLVKWKGRLVILTARHVIQDAKKILVWFYTGKTYAARVLSADATWDIAVLETDALPEGVEGAELELGADAKQSQGDRLESCGYGPDGKLACNNGLFLGYRRSSAAPCGPDDWMVISGHARGGDSGGPVFNRRGRLVGVLWGTDGKEVVCVQAGRIHLALDAAVSQQPFEQKAMVPVIATRTPTPPADLARPTPIEDLPRCPPAETTLVSLGGPGQNVEQRCLPQLFRRNPSPSPQPSVVVQPDPEVRRSLGSIDSKLDALIPPRMQSKPTEDENHEPSPLVAGLLRAGAVVVGFGVYFGTHQG